MTNLTKSLAGLLALGLCTILSNPAHAVFPAGKRCYVQPGLRHATDTMIADLSQSLSDTFPTENKACRLFARALLYQFEGRTERAIADYSDAVGWMRDFPAAYEMRGDAYEARGEHEKALADYAQAAKWPESAYALASRCWARAVRGYPLDRALADCNASLRQRPDNPDALNGRCFLRYRMADYAAAISDCDAALKRAPKGAASLYVRGLAKLKAGDTAGGRADVEAANAINEKVADYYALWGVNE
jgi:tetratricopeptide (TPR) repeat protein